MLMNAFPLTNLYKSVKLVSYEWLKPHGVWHEKRVNRPGRIKDLVNPELFHTARAVFVTKLRESGVFAARTFADSKR